MTPEIQSSANGAANGAPPVFGSPKPVLMGYREFGRHRGVSLRAVQKAIEAGRISTVEVDGKKMIDAARADRDWEANTAKPPGSTSNGEAQQRLIPGAAEFERPAPAAPPAAGPEEGSYAAAKAKREMAQAKLAELELGERAGSLVPKAAIGREMMLCGRWLKQALDNIPARLSALVAATNDEHEVHRILKGEIRKIEEELVERLLGGNLEAEAA